MTTGRLIRIVLVIVGIWLVLLVVGYWVFNLGGSTPGEGEGERLSLRTTP
jgi:hypothetical protein